MNKMIQIENISKVFRTTEVETVALCLSSYMDYSVCLLSL